MSDDVLAEIIRGQSILHEPGDVVEVRAISGAKNMAVSGRNYNDVKSLSHAIYDLDATGLYSAIYTTLHKVRPGHVGSVKSEHVSGYEWFFVDVDPVRHTIEAERAALKTRYGREDFCSSTDTEKQASQNMALKVREYLKSRGFPEPIIVDSGNGYHLLYRTCQPWGSDEERDAAKGTFKAALSLLDLLFSDDTANVDVSVHDPARIIKAPGTMTRKGDDTQARPHRRAQVLSVPVEVEPLPWDRLRELEDEYLKTEASFEIDIDAEIGEGVYAGE